jgi:hypothetical protein
VYPPPPSGRLLPRGDFRSPSPPGRGVRIAGWVQGCNWDAFQETLFLWVCVCDHLTGSLQVSGRGTSALALRRNIATIPPDCVLRVKHSFQSGTGAHHEMDSSSLNRSRPFHRNSRITLISFSLAVTKYISLTLSCYAALSE